MNLTLILIIAVASFGLGGCAKAPLAPMVQVMPAPGKPMDLFQHEIVDCKKFAFDGIGGQAAVDQVNNQAALSTLVGTGIGAAGGALLSGGGRHVGSSAAVGAGAGLGVGAGVGAVATEQGNMSMQQMYDNFYSQCMYSKGNQVPGMQQAAPVVGRQQTPGGDEAASTMNAQQLLTDAGYDPGVVDGSMNSKTKKAIKEFQKDNGLKVTGRLDKRTISMLNKDARREERSENTPLE